ncbi:MAG: maleylacetoacetate isomerase [Gammaproteobacteria bacterium]|nr:maleylacetoacetate isomerase [Gammaproteobacteria bacterium]TVQ44613.1 MAG: maleylacetoacetate isomerase [Gammaproteobacteria bacterium]
MILYDYFRSSAAWRVRIALALKQLEVTQVAVSLVDGEQGGAAYRALNPQGLVPALDTGEAVLSGSLAIIEWLEERHPEPPLLPREPTARALARGMAQLIACDIHPLNNLRVLNYLRGPLGQDDAAVRTWYAHWIGEGFRALEARVQAGAVGPAAAQGPFLGGTRPGLADLCLVPQVYNARRFDVPLEAYPRLLAAEAACLALPAFSATAPRG